MYFLDTNIFVHASNKDAKWFDICHEIVFKDNWLTSMVVLRELKEIKRRRWLIYCNIISADYEKFEGKKVWEFYTGCIKSSLGNCKNDERHLLELYHCILQKTGLTETDTLDKEIIERIKETVFPLLLNIKVILGKIINLFDNVLFYAGHVVPEVWKTPSAKYLKNKQLYVKLKDAKDNKEDLKILIDAIMYGNNKNISLDFITGDAYLSGNAVKIKKIIKDMESHHLHAEINIIPIEELQQTTKKNKQI